MGLQGRIFVGFVVGLGLALGGTVDAVAQAPAATPSAGLALVVDRVGAVSLDSAGAARPVATLAILPAGTRLVLAAAASLTLLYVASGDEYIVSGPGSAQVDATGVLVAQGASARRRAPGATRPVHLRSDAVTMGGVVMRGGGLRARSPAGLLIAAPTEFEWEAFARNGRYLVELRDAAGALLFEGRSDGLSLSFPESLALRPGERYAWTVSAGDDSAVAITSGASFALAADDVRAAALSARPGEGAAFSDRLVYALWLEQAGAVGAARRAWRALAEERPDDDALAARARR